MSPEFKYLLLGIDLAATIERTAVCALGLGKDGKLDLISSPAADPLAEYSHLNSLAEIITSWVDSIAKANSSENLVIAIDVPFGWPVRFREFVRDHSAISFHDIPEVSKDEFRYRLTDRFTRKHLSKIPGVSPGRVTPLSVSTDRLGVTALVGAEILSRLEKDLDVRPNLGNEKTPRDSIEVYPKASLVSWLGAQGLVPYKGKEFLSDHPIVASVAARFGLNFNSPLNLAAELKTDHDFDAFVCALTAYEYSQGRTLSPKDARIAHTDANIITNEGWMWIPTVTS